MGCAGVPISRILHAKGQCLIALPGTMSAAGAVAATMLRSRKPRSERQRANRSVGAIDFLSV
jgi:hypothetical protein